MKDPEPTTVETERLSTPFESETVITFASY